MFTANPQDVAKTGKTVRKARKKHRQTQDKYSSAKKKKIHSLDGSLYFPVLGILVKSGMHHFDTLSMGSQRICAWEPGVQHMNITPLNAFRLEEQGFIPEGKPEEIEIVNEDVAAVYASPENPDITIKQKCEVIVIDSIKAFSLCGTTKEAGSDWVYGPEIAKAVEYLSSTHVEEAIARNVDVIALFATPSNPRGDLHCLTMRWLSKQQKHQTANDSHELYQYFWGLLSPSKGKMEVSRVGGSNGKAHISKEFFRMLHMPGITPRKSHSVMWYPVKNKWYYLYISPYNKKWTLCC
jgi:hypothetical protein